MDGKLLDKLMEKKKDGKKKLDPNYKNAKMSALSSMHDEMGKMLADDVKGLKKVTVASPDKEGLKEGLEKAEELIDQVPGEENHEEEMPQSLDEIEMKIKELEALKAQLQQKE